jgi:hypothetical protein
VLQEKALHGGRYLNRATSDLATEGSSGSFLVSWPAELHTAKSVVMRVAIFDGHRLIAHSLARHIAIKPSFSLDLMMRRQTVVVAPSALLSISGPPAGDQTAVLRPGAKVPAVGAVIVADPSAAAPSGLFAAVTAIVRLPEGRVRLATRPAPLNEAFSIFRAEFGGTLAELASQTGHDARARTAVAAGFKCNTSGAITPSLSLDLSKFIVSAELDTSVVAPYFAFSLLASPDVTLGLRASGGTKCVATFPKQERKIWGPLFVSYQPIITLEADGSVNLTYAWHPFFSYILARGRGQDLDDRMFNNHGTLTLSGEVHAHARLQVNTSVSLAGRAGLEGSITPHVDATGTVTATPPPARACLTATGAVDYELDAFADVFVAHWHFELAKGDFLSGTIFTGCTSLTSGSGGNAGGGGGGDGSGAGGGGSGGGGGSSGTGGGGGGVVDGPEPPQKNPEELSGPVGVAASPLTWSAPDELPAAGGENFGSWLNGISCPSSTLCVAVDTAGNIVTSTRPLEGQWTVSLADPEPTAVAFNCPPGALCFGTSTGGMRALSCASTRLCVAVDGEGNAVWSTDPDGGPSQWHISKIDGYAYLESISCPTDTLCVAGDSDGRLLISHDPTGGAGSWTHVGTATYYGSGVPVHSLSCPNTTDCYGLVALWAFELLGSTVIHIDPATGSFGEVITIPTSGYGPVGLSCPTASLCVGNNELGDVFSAADPSVPSNWTSNWITQVPNDYPYFYPPLSGPACADSGFCIFNAQGAWTTTEPGTTHWARNELFNDYSVTDLSCLSPVECIGVDAYGGITAVTSLGGNWGYSFVDPQRGTKAVSCWAAAHCAAITVQGGAVTTPDAGAQPPMWSPHYAQATYTVAVSCVRGELCAAVTEGGGIATVKDPETEEWKVTQVDSDSSLSAISCPSANLCLAVDTEGGGPPSGVLTSTDPTAGTGAWSRTDADPSARLKGVSCPSVSLCVAVDDAGDIITTHEPAAEQWTKPEKIDEQANLTSISCPSLELCVAVDASGHVLATTHPAAGASSWSAPQEIAGDMGLHSVSCASAALCVAVNSRGKIQASGDPTAGMAGWSAPVAVDPDGPVSSVSCTSEGCVAVDTNGYTIYGRSE